MVIVPTFQGGVIKLYGPTLLVVINILRKYRFVEVYTILDNVVIYLYQMISFTMLDST